jgi:hypothetical protein
MGRMKTEEYCEEDAVMVLSETGAEREEGGGALKDK